MKKIKLFTIFKCGLFGSAIFLSIWNVIKMFMEKYESEFLIQNIIVILFFGVCFVYSYKDYKKKKELFLRANSDLDLEEDEEDNDYEE